MQYKEFNNNIYDSFNKFSAAYVGLLIMGIWAFFEASFWFIIPDFALLLLILVNPKQYKKYFSITFIASFFGLILYYFFAVFNTELALKILLATPFTTQVMIDQVITNYATQGITTTLIQANSGIPSKVWTYVVIIKQINFFKYVALISVSRIIRIFITAFVAAQLGTHLKKYLRNHFTIFLIVYTSFFFFVLFRIS